MAQLKDLIVTGPARIIGTLYAQSASTDLAGLVKLGGGTTNFLRADGTWAAPPNDKGVTSVAASGSGGITISGSPITSTGTIAIGLNLSTAINGLGEGSSPATMNDYAVVQYAGGGTSITTYHRRKLSNILTKANIEAGLGYARGAANGIAPLNASSKIDSTYLPSYVDDVLGYDAKADFPATGEDGKIYIDEATNKTYRWGGSTAGYVEISASLALGNTASTAAKGNHTHTVTATGTVATSTATTENKTATVSAASSGTTTYTPAGTNSAPTFTGTAATISVSKSYTPAGSVAAPTFTGTKASGLTVSPASSGTATYTPAGTVSQPTFTGTAATISVSKSYTPAGTVAAPTFTGTKATGLTVSPASSGTATYTPEGTNSAPTFTGTAATISVSKSYTPAGSVSTPTFTGTQATISVSKSYTPAGTINTPTISLKTAASAGTAITGTSVTNEVLSFTTGSFKNGDAAYQSNALTFTGTAATITSTGTYTPAGTVSQPTFTGTAATITSTGSYTPAGTVSAPTFTGTGKRLVLQDYTPAGTNSAPAFTGTAATITSTGSYTPAGTVSQPTFTGTGKRLVLQDYTPAGTNSAPAFTGTAATITSTGSYTPAGSVSAPTFTGTAVRLVTGNIAVPKTYTSTFTGTSATTSVPA